MPEDFFHMWRIGKFSAQVLPSKVQMLMQAGAPLGTIAHIINNAIQGNVHRGSTLAGAAAQFHFGDFSVGDAHALDYTWQCFDKENLLKDCLSGGFRVT
jgi:hypothetical protein